MNDIFYWIWSYCIFKAEAGGITLSRSLCAWASRCSPGSGLTLIPRPQRCTAAPPHPQLNQTASQPISPASSVTKTSRSTRNWETALSEWWNVENGRPRLEEWWEKRKISDPSNDEIVNIMHSVSSCAVAECGCEVPEGRPVGTGRRSRWLHKGS